MTVMTVRDAFAIASDEVQACDWRGVDPGDTRSTLIRRADVERLEAENRMLRAFIDRGEYEEDVRDAAHDRNMELARIADALHDKNRRDVQRIGEMDAGIERLLQAGDDLYGALCDGQRLGDERVHEAMSAWEAVAKPPLSAPGEGSS